MQERDIDPESNFFDQVTRNCSYYTEHQFKEKIQLGEWYINCTF